jgi:hypothetical protein
MEKAPASAGADWHVFDEQTCRELQELQVAPFPPQTAWAVPGWHCAIESQQPEQVAALQGD